MTVKARFYIAELTRFPGQAGGSVCLRPVTRGARNASWSAATPSGELRMTITNPEAFGQFAARMDEPGAPEYEITFEPVPVPHPSDGHAFEASPAGHYAQNSCALCSAGELDPNGKPTHAAA